MASKVLQELDLTQGSLRKDLLAEDIGDFFDGDPVAGQVVCGSTMFLLDAVSLAWCAKDGRKGCLGPQNLMQGYSLRHKDLPYDTISALPKLLSYIITLIDDKILIEDLEVLPTLEFSHRFDRANGDIKAPEGATGKPTSP